MWRKLDFAVVYPHVYHHMRFYAMLRLVPYYIATLHVSDCVIRMYAYQSCNDHVVWILQM